MASTINITVEPSEILDGRFKCNACTVRVDEDRILSISTASSVTAARWLKEVSKLTTPGMARGWGLARERENVKGGTGKDDYDILEICCGSQCLIFQLSGEIPKTLKTLFEKKNIVAIGMAMETIAINLEKSKGIRFGKKVGLSDEVLPVPIKGTPSRRLDLLVQFHLGINGGQRTSDGAPWYVEPNEEKNTDGKVFTAKKMGFLTLDAYLCFPLGRHLFLHAGVGHQ